MFTDGSKGLMGVLLMKAGYTYDKALEFVEELEWASREKEYRVEITKLDEA